MNGGGIKHKNLYINSIQITKNQNYFLSDIVDFEYKNDGTCFMIYKNNEFGEDILAANIGQPGVSFSWDEVGDYYKNADPIIPQ